jgi:hypothetical protein
MRHCTAPIAVVASADSRFGEINVLHLSGLPYRPVCVVDFK